MSTYFPIEKECFSLVLTEIKVEIVTAQKKKKKN